MTKKQNRKPPKRRVRAQEKRFNEDSPNKDIMQGRAARRRWGQGEAKQ